MVESENDTESETVLFERAKVLESWGSQKIQFTMEHKRALEELLHDVYAARCPKPSDYHDRRDLVRLFNAMARDIYGSRNEFPVVEAFGSFSMDIFSAESDLDLSLNFSNDAVEFPREKKIQALKKFATFLNSLQRRGDVSGVQPIMGARVPIVKFVDRGTGIECDISVENKNGITKSQIVHLISAIDERFQKLSFLMKAWAKAHGINSSKDGTLNSFGIISLVAFHLQTRDPAILPPFSVLLKDGINPTSVMASIQGFLHYGEQNKETLAELFVTLLYKLASMENLWPEGLCVSTFTGSWISKKWAYREKSNLGVEDFTKRSENVARTVRIEGVKKIYKSIHDTLHCLSAFMGGQFEIPKIKNLLFGQEPIPTLGNSTNRKRSGPLPQVDLNPTKNNVRNARPLFAQSIPPEGPSFGYGVPQMPSYGRPSPQVDLNPLNPTKKMRFTEGWNGNQVQGVSPRNAWIPPEGPSFGYGVPQMPLYGPLHPPLTPLNYRNGSQHTPRGMVHGPLRYHQNTSQFPPFYPYGHG